MGELFDELVVGCRQLRQSRGALASLTLAIGLSVGANLAVFTQLYDVLAPASPFADEAGLVILENTGGYSTKDGDADTPQRRRLSAPDFDDVEEHQRTFAALGAVNAGYVTVLSGPGRPRTVCRIFVSPRTPELLGVVPVSGRSFGQVDFESGGAGAALLTEGVWRRYFASAPSVIGHSIQLDEQPFSVIGVMPGNVAEMLQPRTELFAATGSGLCVITPLVRGTAGEAEGVLNYLRSERGRDTPALLVVGRLRSGMSRAQANAELSVHCAGWRSRIPAGRTPSGCEPSRFARGGPRGFAPFW